MTMTRIQARKRLLEWLGDTVSLYNAGDREAARAANLLLDEEVFDEAQLNEADDLADPDEKENFR